MNEKKDLLRIKMGGFGKFSSRSIGPFTSGLNVVFGLNEAGKSTSMECVRQVLYGWTRADGTGMRNDYVPYSKTRVASLYFANSHGEWELSRAGSDASVKTHRGVPWDQAFEDLTTDVSKETFGSIFSFDSEDLQEISRSAEGVTAKLLTAGAGTKIAPIEALSDIENEISELLSARKNTPHALGNLRKEIYALSQRIDSLSACAQEFAEEHLELARLRESEKIQKKEYEELGVRIADARRSLMELERLEAQLVTLQQEIEEIQPRHHQKEEEAMSASLSPEEQDLFLSGSKVEAAYGNLAALQSAFDRVQDRKREVERLKMDLAEKPTSGCDIGMATKQGIANRQTRRSELEGALAGAEQNLKELEARRAGYDAKATFSSELKPSFSASNLSVFVVGIIACISGLISVYFGVTLPISAVIYTGGVLVLVGLVLVFLGFPRKTEVAKVSATQEERVRHEAFVEQLGIARHKVEAARTELETFNAESVVILEKAGFKEAKGSLGVAQKMLLAEEIAEELRKDLAIKKEAYESGRDELEEIVGRIKAKFRDDLVVREANVPELIAWLSYTRGQLSEVQEKQRASRLLQDELERIESQTRVALEAREMARVARDEIVERYNLGAYDVVAVFSDKIESAEDTLKTLDDRRNDMQMRQGKLVAILEAGSQDEQLAVLREELEQKKALRMRSAARLAELVVARNLIKQAIMKWEEEKQPEVYRLASELFSDMTQGSWRKVDFDGKTIFVVSATSEKQLPEKLSCGTRQQLYLSLRIALLLMAKEIGSDLPVLADDILVNFDEYRRVGAARALVRLAQERQVILFTCHRSIKDLLYQISPDAHVFEISA